MTVVKNSVNIPRNCSHALNYDYTDLEMNTITTLMGTFDVADLPVNEALLFQVFAAESDI